VGFHDAELTPLAVVALNTVCGPVSVTALPAVSCPGVNVPVPVVAVAGPDQYEILVSGIGSRRHPLTQSVS
jgi:hypothetical protein